MIAIATDPNNAFSWRCYSARALASAPTGPSIVAPIASTIGTPRQIFHSWRHNLLNVLITIAVMPFITFPAIILNDTLSENYDEILVMLALARRRARHPWRSRTTLTKPTELNVSDTARGQPHRDPRDARARRWWFAVTLVAGAVLGGMLNPKFGINQQSVLGVIATLVAFIVGAALSWFVATKYRTRHSLSTEAFLRGLPAGLGVAALCVAISRLSDFQPGYLYGVVAGVAYVESMTRRATAHLVTLTTLSTLAVAAGAWMAWIPVNHLALQRGANVLVVLTDDLLGSLFIGGLVGTVVGLLPLEFMPGGSVAKWRKDVWAAVFFFAVFLLISVELNPASGPTHPGRAPVVTALVLFVLFATLSFGTRSYFARRHAHGSESVADKIG